MRVSAGSPTRQAGTGRRPCSSPTTHALAAPLPQPRVDVLAKLVRDEGFDAVLFAQSVLASDVAAGLAARLDAGLNWDLVDLAGDDGASSASARRSATRSTWTSAGLDTGARDFSHGYVRPEPGRRRGRGARAGRRARGALDPGRARRAGGGESGRPVDRGRGRDRRRRSRARRAREVRAGRGSSRRRSAARSPRRAPSSTRAGIRTRRRSARRARRSRRSSTSRSGSPGAIQHKVGMQGSG